MISVRNFRPDPRRRRRRPNRKVFWAKKAVGDSAFWVKKIFNHMHQKGFINIIFIVAIVIVVGAVGYFAFMKKSEPVAQQPTLTPTPSGGTGSVKSGSGTVQPEDPNKSGLAPYPDLQISSISGQPFSIKFVVEHRSALNGKTILIHGAIVSTLLGEKACPPDRGMCAQPSIFLADTTDKNRNPLYDLRILVGEEEQEKSYPIGNALDLQVTVDGSKVAVVAHKDY